MNTRPALVRLAVMAFLALSSPLLAQAAPAGSRGEQMLSITTDECMRRARASLVAEGFSIAFEGGGHIWGHKQIHTAVIMCNDASGGRTWVNVVVMSEAADGNVPGAERVRLQAQMERATTTSVPGDPLGTVWIVDDYGWKGVWTRRGTSATFDAVWTGSWTVTALVEISISGNRVSLRRFTNSDGVQCEYEGTLQADGVSVKGTHVCSNNPQPYPWSAVISRP